MSTKWERSDTIALAAPHCAGCRGLGLRGGRQERTQPCNCVLRGIFRACFARFQLIATNEPGVSRISLEANPGQERKTLWGRKDEEFAADFCLVSRRTLNETEYRIFRFHFLLGADWHLCCRRLKMDRGAFFHAVYRIQQKLGRVFRDLEPYALYPIDEYFNGTTKQIAGVSVPTCTVVPIRPPLAARKVEPSVPKAA